MAEVQCRNCGRCFCYTENIEKVRKAVSDINKSLSELSKIVDEFQKLIELIPENFGKKDELGQNVEEYMKEMSDNIGKKFCDKISRDIKLHNKRFEYNANNEDLRIARELRDEHYCPPKEEGESS